VSNDAFIGQILVNPGGTLEGMDGRSGTLWLSEPRRQNLYIGEGGIASLQLGSDGTNDYTFGSVVIGPNGSLAIDSYVRTVIIGNAGATAAVGRVATLYLDTLDVQTTGTLTAKGNGFIDMFTKWSYPAWGPGLAAMAESSPVRWLPPTDQSRVRQLWEVVRHRTVAERWLSSAMQLMWTVSSPPMVTPP
jgi:hypothetical protein